MLSGMCLVSYDLFEDGSDSENKAKANKRLINAKVLGLTFRMSIDNLSKGIKLVVGYEETSMKDFSSRWIVE